MKRDNLIAWVLKYYDRTNDEIHPCEHGHIDCAMVPNGRCFNETLAELETLGVDVDSL